MFADLSQLFLLPFLFQSRWRQNRNKFGLNFEIKMINILYCVAFGLNLDSRDAFPYWIFIVLKTNGPDYLKKSTQKFVISSSV